MAQVVTAPPELLYNLRLWLHSLNVPVDEIPDERLAGLIAGPDCHRDIFQYSVDGTHIEYEPLPDIHATVTLADGTTVEFLRGKQPEWTVRNWRSPNLFDLYRMLDNTFVPKPKPFPLVLTGDADAFAAGLERAHSAVEKFAESCRQTAAAHPELLQPSPCPDCRGTGQYAGLTSVETCRTCGGRGTQ